MSKKKENNKNLSILTKEDSKIIQGIIDEISKNPKAEEFLQPVDWEGTPKPNLGLQLLDYPKLIANPMDLGTLKVIISITFRKTF